MKIEEKNEEILSLSTRLIDKYVVKLKGNIKDIKKTEELNKH